MIFINNLINEIFSENVIKIVLSNKRAHGLYSKMVVKPVKIKGEVKFQFEGFKDNQVFHENMGERDAKEYVAKLLAESFRQMDAFNDKCNFMAKFTKSEKLLVNKKAVVKAVKTEISHNREKQYIFKEGVVVPPLVDIGVMNAEGFVVKAKYDKYKQINRFAEIIGDVIDEGKFESLRIIDFGCGKSYLTFILYYFLTEIKGIKAEIVGLDLKKDVINNCNEIARKYGYVNLRFELGDINGYKSEKPVDMVISLHACDTATDYAIYNAVKMGAKFIFAVPCCQHEVNKQMSRENSLLLEYGLIKERFSALVTDAVRGNMLVSQGYKVHMLEFIDIEHSPKNLLIRAVKGNVSEVKRERAVKEVRDVMREYSISPKLWELFSE